VQFSYIWVEETLLAWRVACSFETTVLMAAKYC